MQGVPSGGLVKPSFRLEGESRSSRGCTIFEINGGAGCEVDEGYGLAFEVVGADHGHLGDAFDG